MSNIKNTLRMKMVGGVMTDKYGRTFETDWEQFDKDRGKRTAPALTSQKLKQ